MCKTGSKVKSWVTRPNVGEGGEGPNFGIDCGNGHWQVSHCQTQPVGLNQRASDDIIGPRPPLQVVKLKHCAKFEWN